MTVEKRSRNASDEQVIQMFVDLDTLGRAGLDDKEVGERIGMIRTGYLTRVREGTTSPSPKTCRSIRALTRALERGELNLPASDPVAEEPVKKGSGVHSGTTQELIARARGYVERAVRVLEAAEAQATGLYRPGVQAVRQDAEALARDLEV